LIVKRVNKLPQKFSLMEKSADQKRDERALFRLSALTVIILILLSLFYSSCSYECDKIRYTYYDQIQVDLDSIRNSVDLQNPKGIEEPGGLYYKDGFVYINERGQGIHIIDNTNPINPVPVSFIQIPGNYGLAARQNSLYADSYTDLLVFDISDPHAIEMTSRSEYAFVNLNALGAYYDAYSDILYDYQEREVTTTECDMDSDVSWWGQDDAGTVLMAATSDFNRGGGSETGSAGSMARFVVTNEVLYTVDHSSLNVFDVSVASQPEKKGTVGIGWGIETIFPYNQNLFIGAQDGMYIFDNQNPLAPQFLSVYSHANACDPVVVQGDYAYVTLRDGSGCQTYTNQLDIVNVSDPEYPQLVKSYSMLNPHGLGINGNCLFICEGAHGLKFFDIDPSDPTKIDLKAFNQSVDAFDVIALPNNLMMVGRDGFYQYDYDCGVRFEYLSTIAFGK
jgi:hypothetical protein